MEDRAQVDDVKRLMCNIAQDKAKCDWICKKGSFLHNYKYLEIPI